MQKLSALLVTVKIFLMTMKRNLKNTLILTLCKFHFNMLTCALKKYMYCITYDFILYKPDLFNDYEESAAAEELSTSTNEEALEGPFTLLAADMSAVLDSLDLLSRQAYKKNSN